MLNIHMSHMTYLQALALARIKGRSMAELIREALAEKVDRDWGTRR